MKKFLCDWAIAWIIAALIMLGVSLIFSLRPSPSTMNQAYVVWIKHTGNPNKLTFDEWKLLVKISKTSLWQPLRGE
jgi:hypothetical protein